MCQLGGHIGTYIPYPWSSAARYVSAGETKEVPAPAAKVIHARVWRPQRQLRRQLQWLGLGLNPDKHAALIVQTSRRCVTEATVVLRIPCVMLVAMGPRCSRKFCEYHERRMVEATTWSLYASFLRKKTRAWNTYCGENNGVQRVAQECVSTMLRAPRLRLAGTSGRTDMCRTLRLYAHCSVCQSVPPRRGRKHHGEGGGFQSSHTAVLRCASTPKLDAMMRC